jgi:hypothetical protein
MYDPAFGSAILVAPSSCDCNPYLCTRCGGTCGSPYCCDANDLVSDLARRNIGPHPVRQFPAHAKG